MRSDYERYMAMKIPQSRHAENNLDNESEIVLDLLNVVHENSNLTQRSMASELGIALGMANTYLKRCVRKVILRFAKYLPIVTVIT